MLRLFTTVLLIIYREVTEMKCSATSNNTSNTSEFKDILQPTKKNDQHDEVMEHG